MQLTLPESTRNGLRALRFQAALFDRFRGFDRSLRRLAASPEAALSIDAAIELYAHWGDPLSQSDESYLRSCLAEATRTRGAIVQCGASLLTLILGRICSTVQPGARQLWCLEDDPHWANVVRSWLTQYRIGAAHVITSRAHLFDGFVWYAVDPERLAQGIRLVFCEGGRATPGGVIGTLSRLKSRLAADATILARKVTRDGDLKALDAWAQAHGAACVVVDRKEGFVKLRCGAGRAGTDRRAVQSPASSSSQSTTSRSRKLRSP
ncbi:MAG: hypothetical protein RIC56_16805 [Pseudomonadales bacterium]